MSCSHTHFSSLGMGIPLSCLPLDGSRGHKGYSVPLCPLRGLPWLPTPWWVSAPLQQWPDNLLPAHSLHFFSYWALMHNTAAAFHTHWGPRDLGSRPCLAPSSLRHTGQVTHLHRLSLSSGFLLSRMGIIKSCLPLCHSPHTSFLLIVLNCCHKIFQCSNQIKSFKYHLRNHC